MNSALTHERLRQVLRYDAATGVFTWLEKPSRGVKVGSVAGGRKWDSLYVRIKIDGAYFYEHRLAWFYMTGEWPAQEIDHKDTVPWHNWWENLRAATRRINSENKRRARADSSTGVLGVFPNKKGFMSRIKVHGVFHHLGTYRTKELAYVAYVEAKRRFHEGCTL